MGTTSNIQSSLYAGALYFGVVFALGFVLGTIRVLFVVPSLGEWVAVLLELPIILFLAWIVCGWVTARLQVPRSLSPRLIMSACALLLLLAAEAALSIGLFETSAKVYLESFKTPHGALGLSGQVAFALFPVLRLISRPDSESGKT